MRELTSKEKYSKQKYIREFVPPMVFYVVWVFVVPEILDIYGDGWWTIPITLSQVIPLMLVARAIIRFVDRCDELMKLVYMKGAVFTLIILTFFCMGYGFLEIRGYPAIPLFLIGTTSIPIYFISAFFIRRSLDGK